jgi:hypothetical protein
VSVYYPRKQPKPKPTPSGVEARVAAEAHAFADAVRAQAKRVTWERVAIVALLVAVLFLAFRPLSVPAPPSPLPPPSPAPVVGKIWTTLIHDSDHPTQEFAQLEADPKLGSGLNSLGAHLRIFDVKSKVLDDKNLRGYVDTLGGPPVLIVQAEGTHKIAAVKCPANADGVLGEVRKFKGGK